VTEIDIGGALLGVLVVLVDSSECWGIKKYWISSLFIIVTVCAYSYRIKMMC